ncbi:MAG: T9SS type A sorting domain-containing protein, partial [Bacteroidota bacterium]
SCSEKIEQVKIADVTGRIVFTKTFDAESNLQNTRIDVSGFSTGIYFLRAESGGKTFLKKVIVE